MALEGLSIKGSSHEIGGSLLQRNTSGFPNDVCLGQEAEPGPVLDVRTDRSKIVWAAQNSTPSNREDSLQTFQDGIKF